MKSFGNVLEPSIEEVWEADHHLKGKWNSDFFRNDAPLILELGCGKAEYSVELARKYPDHNYLAVDIKGNRMWKGAKIALEEGLKNVGFLRTRVEFVNSFFDKEEVDGIWLTFSDPQPQRRRVKKRLTSPMFIDRYRKFLKKNAPIHLKTDNEILFDYTLEEIRGKGYVLERSTRDVHGEMDEFTPGEQYALGILTHYEKLALERGVRIKYVRFHL